MSTPEPFNPALKGIKDDALRKDFKTLIYPSNLGREIWFPEAIKFTVLKREGTSIERSIEKTVGGFKTGLGLKANENFSLTALAESGENIVGGIIGIYAEMNQLLMSAALNEIGQTFILANFLYLLIEIGILILVRKLTKRLFRFFLEFFEKMIHSKTEIN